MQALGVIAENGAVDFGITALPERLAAEGIDIATLSAPRENAPVLMPAYVDLWSHTSPIPAVDPDVGLFLHGPERGPADISVIWRADVLPEDLAPESGVDLAALMALVPPRAAEAIALPVWTVRRWLARGLTGLGDLADAPMRAEDVAGDGGGRPAFRWAGPGDARTGVVDAQAIRPGDVIVVPAQYGGCDAFGWAPDVEEPVADVAATAAYSWRRRRWAARLRIPPDLDARQSARAKATLTDLGRTLTGPEAAAASGIHPGGAATTTPEKSSASPRATACAPRHAVTSWAGRPARRTATVVTSPTCLSPLIAGSKRRLRSTASTSRPSPGAKGGPNRMSVRRARRSSRRPPRPSTACVPS